MIFLIYIIKIKQINNNILIQLKFKLLFLKQKIKYSKNILNKIKIIEMNSQRYNQQYGQQQNYPNYQSQERNTYANQSQGLHNMSYQQQQYNNYNDVTNQSYQQYPQNQSQYPIGGNFVCEEHNEGITNYCRNMECLKELCPECIDAHFEFHISQNSQAKIESIKNVRNNCSKKLKAAVVSLNGEIEKTEMQYLINPEQIIEDGVHKLQRSKDRVIQQVIQYYDMLENEFRQQAHANILKANDFTLVFDKIKSLIQELELLNNQLDTGNTVQVIKKICLLDLQALVQKFRKDIHKVIDSKDIDPIEIEIDDSKSYNLQQELQKLAKITKQTSEYHNMDGGHNNQQQPQMQQQKQLIQNNSRSQLDNYSQPMKLNQQPIQQQQQNAILQYEQNLQTSPQNLIVDLPNYFTGKSDEQKQILHYFLQEDSGSRIFIWNLQENSYQFDDIEIADMQLIPTFHKSLATPNGDIYLTGGRNPDGNKSNDIYKFDMRSRKLLPVSKMQFSRSSHGVVYMNGKIYLCGGYTNVGKKSQITNTVEEFDIETRKVRQVASLNHASVSTCLTAFNNKYIYKFGGMSENRLMSPHIEKYDPAFDTWTVIDPKIQPQQFQLLSTGCCAQINPEQILVFGGYNHDNQSSRQCYVFEVDEKNDGNCEIKCINWKPLPKPEGFWNNQAIVQNNTLFALQNVASDSDINCLQNERKILTFNGQNWVINNPENQFQQE